MKQKSLKDLFLLRDHEVNRFLTETPRDYFIPGDYVIDESITSRISNPDLDAIVVYKVIFMGKGVSMLASGLLDGIPMTTKRHNYELVLLTRAKFNELYNKFKKFISPVKIDSSRLLRRTIHNLVSKIYPEERFEVITFNRGLGADEVLLRIHYPEITITNSAGQELHTKNFYAQFLFGQNKCLDDLDLARTHYTTDELIIGTRTKFYIHSHVSKTTPGEWANNFCFGHTSIAVALSNLKEGKLEFLNTFLLNFETILGWESIEGAPHINMGTALRKFAEDVVRETRLSEDTDTVDFFYHKLLQNYSPDLNYSVGEYGHILVKYAEQIHTILDEIASQYPEKLAHTVYPYDEIREISGIVGINPTIEDNLISQLHGMESEVMFKNEIKLINIEKAENKTDENYPNRVHKDIVQQIVKRLEEGLTEFLIKNINYYDKPENIQREYSNS